MLRKVGLGCGGLLGLLVVLAIIGAAIGGNQSSNTSSSSSSSSSSGSGGSGDQGSGSQDSGEQTVKIGQAATVADASWTVTNAYATNQLQDQFGVQPPKQGNFIVVEFNYTNNGTEAKDLSPNALALYDSSNRKSSPDTDDFGYVPQDKNILLNQVNPGVSKSGEVIFSVASGGSGYKLELSNTNFLKGDKAYVDLGF